jgi:aryl-alcohol dehydrogenase-like predicted oxidoreductase
MSWGTLDKGILTGTVNAKRKFDEADCRSWAPWWKSQDFKSKYEVVEKLKPIVHSFGFSMSEFAIGFNKSFEELSTPICGARNLDQLNDLIKSLKHLPTKKEIEMILSKFKNENRL